MGGADAGAECEGAMLTLLVTVVPVVPSYPTPAHDTAQRIFSVSRQRGFRVRWGFSPHVCLLGMWRIVEDDVDVWRLVG